MKLYNEGEELEAIVLGYIFTIILLYTYILLSPRVMILRDQSHDISVMETKHEQIDKLEIEIKGIFEDRKEKLSKIWINLAGKYEHTSDESRLPIEDEFEFITGMVDAKTMSIIRLAVDSSLREMLKEAKERLKELREDKEENEIVENKTSKCTCGLHL